MAMSTKVKETYPLPFLTETASPLDIEDLISKYAFGDVKKEANNETK